MSMKTLLIAIALVGVACANSTPVDPSSGQDLPPGFAKNRDLWNAQNIDTYTVTLFISTGSRGPFCGSDHAQVAVQDGAVVAVREPYGCVVDPNDPELAWVPFTIDEDFDLIAENGIEAEYDETLGFPRYFYAEGPSTYQGEPLPTGNGTIELSVLDLEIGRAHV